MPTTEEIFEKVRDALTDALGVDEDEVIPQATLVGDLGAESIDFLDIQFKLDKAFNIKIKDLFPQDLFTTPQFVQDGKITEAGLAELRRRMPWASFDSFSTNAKAQDVMNALTVQDLCKFVESKLGAAS